MQRSVREVGDLFPDTLQRSAVGPRFFALYPDARELPEIIERQLRLCRELAPGSITPRPSWMLHVSAALCGTPRRLRHSMEEALRRAQEAFCFPAFDVVLDSVACFGSDGTALVVVADEASQQRVNELRVALADAQRGAGLSGSRGNHVAHLTLGYGENLPGERRSIAPLRFHVGAVDLVMSNTGKSEHIRLGRWLLRS